MESQPRKVSLEILNSGVILKTFTHASMNICLSISFIISFGCSKEPSHWDGSFEYQQYIYFGRKRYN